MNEYEASYSPWYRPGNWALPRWWTNGPWARDGRLTHAEQRVFYTGRFCREVLGHTGGMTTPPKPLDKGVP